MLLAGAWLATPSQAADQTEIYLVQGLPNQTVDVRIDGKAVAQKLAATKVAGPFDVKAGSHTVTVSQLLNEYFAKEAGLEDWQLGLGHAFEIDPDRPESFRLELAHALLAR